MPRWEHEAGRGKTHRALSRMKLFNLDSDPSISDHRELKSTSWALLSPSLQTHLNSSNILWGGGATPPLSHEQRNTGLRGGNAVSSKDLERPRARRRMTRRPPASHPLGEHLTKARPKGLLMTFTHFPVNSVLILGTKRGNEEGSVGM